MINIPEQWSLSEDKQTISCKRKFKNFAQSLAFVNQVGVLAEEANHHPDIHFGWGYCTLTLTTHDAGGLTEKDERLATQINLIG